MDNGDDDPPLTNEQIFEEAFPEYLAMGMSPEQYWEATPQLAVSYRKAYIIRKKSENEHAWLQGLYFYDAFAVVLSNAFSKRTHKEKYFEHPIDLYPLTKAEKKIREMEAEKKMEQVMMSMIRKQQQEKSEG